MGSPLPSEVIDKIFTMSEFSFMHQTKYRGIITEAESLTTPPWEPALRWRNLLESLSVHWVVVYVLAGWEASGYTCISR